MKRFCRALFVFAALFTTAAPLFAQVDIEHRRILQLQTGVGIEGEEQLGALGYFWFNENNFPATNMALRVVFAGVFLDSELSFFCPANSNLAAGVGLSGGFFAENVTPYIAGERQNGSEFYGDSAVARVFVNVTIPNPTPLPLNLRATYGIWGTFFRESGNTASAFRVPDDYFTQFVLAEMRFGGIEPGLLTKRGAELYLAADVNYRDGQSAYGPASAIAAHNKYTRAIGSVAAFLPVFNNHIVGARIISGTGDDLDQMSAFRIGGNWLGAAPYTFTLHGYYTREFFADDFVLVNLSYTLPIAPEWYEFALHFYGDFASLKGLNNTIGGAPINDPPPGWHDFYGAGAGISFRGPWQTDVLIAYGHGFDGVRNGRRGAHEISLGIEKRF
jgi:hypothetical protein